MSASRATVALVIDTLERGGAERVLVSIANGLDPARYRVVVVTTRQPGTLAAELRPEVPVHALGRRTRGDVAALWRFAELLRRERAAIVHTHSHTAAYFAVLARTLFRRRWLHVVHDHHGPVESSAALRAADRLLVRRPAHYFAVSDRLATYARESLRLPPSRCERLVNGVPLGAAPVEPPGPGEELRIVHVARFAAEKDHGTALRAAALLRDRLPRARWWFVGRHDTPEGRECRAAAERLGLRDRTAFLGERADVRAVLRDAHVGVLTSRQEGLPLALLEYMAEGLPAVVTDAGDCGRVVRASGGGQVVPPGDAGGVADAIARLADDPAWARRAGAANHVHARDHFSDRAMVARVAAVYDHLLAGRAAGRPRAPARG